MANPPSMELPASSGVDPKTAKALGEFVEKTVNKSIEKTVDNAVEKALKSFEIAARSRPQEAAQRPSSKAIPVLTGIIALAAVVTVQLGTIYWLNDSIRSEVSELRSDMREDIRSLEAKVEAKIDDLRAEIGDLRAGIGDLRAEIGALRERVTRIEVVVEDRLPAAP